VLQSVTPNETQAAHTQPPETSLFFIAGSDLQRAGARLSEDQRQPKEERLWQKHDRLLLVSHNGCQVQRPHPEQEDSQGNQQERTAPFWGAIQRSKNPQGWNQHEHIIGGG
jgi:hypothetical protein